MEAIRAAIADITSTCGRITMDLSDATRISHNGAIDITAAEKAVDDAENALRDAENHLQTEGQNALKKAKEAQEKFGQQSERMTEIAHEAREEAEKYYFNLIYLLFFVSFIFCWIMVLFHL